MAGDRDHKFSAGYPSFKAEGAVFWTGNIRPVSPGANCDLEKSDPVAHAGATHEAIKVLR
jgi:hypothetical protein